MNVTWSSSLTSTMSSPVTTTGTMHQLEFQQQVWPLHPRLMKILNLMKDNIDNGDQRREMTTSMQKGDFTSRWQLFRPWNGKFKARRSGDNLIDFLYYYCGVCTNSPTVLDSLSNNFRVFAPFHLPPPPNDPQCLSFTPTPKTITRCVSSG